MAPQVRASQGRQTYRCGCRRYHFTPKGNRVFRPETVKAQAAAMYCEGSNLRAISRVPEAPLLTVYGWVKKALQPLTLLLLLREDAGR